MNLSDVQIQKLWLETQEAMITEFRGYTQDFFALPNIFESLEFALTELAEALDASLRTDDRFARNNSRNISVKDELIDAFLMLGTAYIQLEATEHFQIGNCLVDNINETEERWFIIKQMRDVSTIYSVYYEGAYGTAYYSERTAKEHIGAVMMKIAFFLPDWENRLQVRMNQLINKHGATTE